MNIFKRFAKYCQTCYNELVHEVTWPTGKELLGSAKLVLVASVVIALVVFVMDFTFEKIMGVVYPG